MYTISIASFIFVITHDSPKYLVNTGQVEEAKRAIAKIYDKSENVEEIFMYLEATSQRETSDVTIV
jgi:hypothetical protein